MLWGDRGCTQTLMLLDASCHAAHQNSGLATAAPWCTPRTPGPQVHPQQLQACHAPPPPPRVCRQPLLPSAPLCREDSDSDYEEGDSDDEGRPRQRGRPPSKKADSGGAYRHGGAPAAYPYGYPGMAGGDRVGPAVGNVL